MARRPVAAKGKPLAAAAQSKVLVFVDRIDEAGVGGWAVDFARPEERAEMQVEIAFPVAKQKHEQSFKRGNVAGPRA